ncbi:PaaI family thioesterase [Micrococcales bacterium 31B]|nr:PaaI family thioesterase [Micrococcales bacterium 31B]
MTDSTADNAVTATDPLDPATVASDENARAVLEYCLASDTTLIKALGVQFTHVSADLCSATMPVAGNTQPMGLLHGGASLALAETLASVAAMVHANTMGAQAVGTEVSGTHLRSARSGLVTGTATALHRGKSTVVYQVEVRDDQQKLLCHSRVSCMILHPRD